MQNKFANLTNYLQELGKQGLCLAFSGGIDSTLLLYLCSKLNEKFLAVTFKSIFQTDEEINLTKELCKIYNVNQTIAECDILKNQIIINNPKDRCYHCKKILFSQISKIAQSNQLVYIIDGTNFDDLSEYRPGIKALEETGIISPFAKFGITKQEIREFAKEQGIKLFDKPSTPCLATRLPYNTRITPEKLDIIEKGEKILTNKGFKTNRLRLHDNIARIEIPKNEFDKLLSQKENIITSLKNIGIKHITLDLEGFRSGSMDKN